MPKYLKDDWDGSSISARPIGTRKVFRFWPFFVGDRISFEIRIKQLKDTIQSDNLLVSEEIVGHDGIVIQKDIAQIYIPNMGKDKYITQKISGKTVTSSCEGSYVVCGSLINKVPHTILTFKAHPSEQLAFWLMGLIGIVIGALVGTITTWLLNCR